MKSLPNIFGKESYIAPGQFDVTNDPPEYADDFLHGLDTRGLVGVEPIGAPNYPVESVKPADARRNFLALHLGACAGIEWQQLPPEQKTKSFEDLAEQDFPGLLRA